MNGPLALGYVVVGSTEPERWRRFAEDVLGVMVADGERGVLYLKMDERPFRILVQPSPRDGLIACGWEYPDEQAWQQAIERLPGSSTPARTSSNGELASRRVQAMASLLDPSGNRHELFWGVRSDFAPFRSPQNVPRFVTGELGMGHVVLPAPKFDATWAFFRDVLGFGLSDLYLHRPNGPDDPLVQRLHFCHCDNGRHHSLALFETEIAQGCGHLMVEVDSMTEVGRAHDHMQHHGARCMASLGQHVNDRMTSFYVQTPSGFSLEVGWGGRVIDWRHHSVFEATEISLWGHDWRLGLAG